jgi:hypothetical protein
LDKGDFLRRFRGQCRIRDQRLEDKLYKKYQPDLRIARQDERELESVFAMISDEVSTYNLGRDRERSDREHDQGKHEHNVRNEQITVQPRPSSYVMARAKAVSEYVAKVASTDTVIMKYRDRVLGRTLTAAEAEQFLTSPVAAIFRARIRPRAKPKNVSYIDYELEEQAEDDSGPYRMLRYGYAGREHETQLRPLLQAPGRGDFLVYAGDTLSPDEWWQQIPDQHASVVLLPTRFDYFVVAKSNSALDLLMKQANKLVHRHLLETTEAAWLILTGEPPEPKYMSATLNSLSTDYISRAMLTLTVDPWVSPDNVKSYYREIRDSILHEAGSKHRTVEVFRFVVAHTDLEETALKKTPQWSHLCDQWNEEYPEGHRWHFSDYRDLRTSYLRGRNAVAFPISE